MEKICLEINKYLSDEDRYRLLSDIPPKEWQAVQETLLEHLESATQYVCDDGVAREAGAVAFYAGQIAALRLLIASFESHRLQGGRTP